MSRKLIAQIFSSNKEYIPTKADLHLRTAGSGSESFVITSDSDTVIDACNFETLDQGANFVIVADNSSEGYTGAGYLKSSLTASMIEAATASYPILGQDDGKYYLWLRVKATATNVHLEISLDNVPFATINQAAAAWTWVSVPMVVFDEVSHNLSISFLSTDTFVDKIIIRKDTSTPTGTGPEFSTSPYVTAIVRLASVSNNIPDTYYNTLGYKTSKDIKNENWYAFDLSTLDNNTGPLNQNALAVVLLAAGTSNQLYLIWDTAAKISNPIATQTDNDGWIASSTETMSLRIYSNIDNVDEYNCSLTTPEAKLVEDRYSDLSLSTLKGKLNNTIYTPDNEAGQDVELDVGEKLINIVVDQSGSNLWNDNTQLRFEFDNQISDVLEAKYPGNIRFNLFEFKGQPSFSFFIPLKEKLQESSVSNIIREHFKNDSDYFAGFRVIRKPGSYSETPIDGEIVFDGYALAALDIDLKEHTDYYYTIFTYDYLYRFSSGIKIKATTNEPIFPRGVPWFTGFTLLGYDLRSDTNTVALWQTDEGSGDYVYDFANSSQKLTLENISWLGITEVETGASGLRFNGLNSRAYSDSTDAFNFDLDQQFSIYAWLNVFENSPEVVVFTNGTSSDLNYAAIIDNGTLKFTFDGSNYYSCNTPFPTNEWTHLAITYNNGLLKFYYNGEVQGVTNPGVFSSSTDLGSNIFTIGYDTAGFTRWQSRYFGKISHISIHNIERTSAEVSAASTPAKGSDDNGNPEPVDNGDRTVVLEYAIADDFDYNYLRILRNPTRQPLHETDGTVIFESSNISSGRFTVSAPYPYDVAETYYFKIFTRNSIGNWCPIEDAHGIDIFIPDVYRPDNVNDITGEKSTTGPGINYSLPAITMVQNRTGNEKVWFKWLQPSEPATRVKIYYSKEKFPYYDKKTESIVGGQIVFNGVKEITEFVHRKLPNREPGFYAIIAFDRLGRFSPPGSWVLARHFPIAELDDSGIPLLEALNVKYHIVDYDRIQITWDTPVVINQSFEGWFDDRFYVYSAICDIYGNTLPIDFKDGFQVISSILEINQSKIEDVYRLGLDTTNADKIPIAEFSVGVDGLVTGLIRLRSSPLFTVINNFTLGCSAKYVYSDTFTYTLPSSTIKFNNPLSLKLTNRDNLYFNTTEYLPPQGCSVDDESGGMGNEKDPRRKRVNGTHIRRKAPFVIRAFYTYKNKAVNSARVFCKIYDSSGGPCSIKVNNPSGAESVNVKTQIDSFPTIKEVKPILDGNGNPTGYTETISYSDIPILAPYLPQDASSFVRCDANGFIAIKKLNLFFPGLLKVSITAAAPESNNIDIREQFATAYLVDPDYPTDSSKFTKPPDGTIAKWEVKNDTKVKVPFYSIDNVPLTNGVYSYFRAGSARNIFFGPANPTTAGTYTISVSTTVRGLFGSASANVEIKGRTGGNFEHWLPDPELPRILAEFPNTLNYVWADGIDYQKMTISRDPNRATTKYAAKFIECSNGVILPLSPGTTINIQAKGYEILTGDVVEILDPDGTRRLDDTNAIRTTDSAQVKLSTNLETYVYFRRSEFIADKGCRELTSVNCAAFDAPTEICYEPYAIGEDLAVILSTKVNFAGKPLNIFGGGHFGNDGRPPCVLVPIEPLYVRYLGLFVNNVPVDRFAVDNLTIHHMYFEVRYKDKAIPTGTPFEVFACDLLPNPPLEPGENCRRINEQVGVPSTVYVYKTNELPGDIADPYNEYSLVDIPIGPISPDNNISLGVYIDITFVDGQPVLVSSSSSSSSSITGI